MLHTMLPRILASSLSFALPSAELAFLLTGSFSSCTQRHIHSFHSFYPKPTQANPLTRRKKRGGADKGGVGFANQHANPSDKATDNLGPAKPNPISRERSSMDDTLVVDAPSLSLLYPTLTMMLIARNFRHRRTKVNSSSPSTLLVFVFFDPEVIIQ